MTFKGRLKLRLKGFCLGAEGVSEEEEAKGEERRVPCSLLAAKANTAFPGLIL